MRAALARLDFPAVLVIYRSAAGLSQQELAERTGFSQSAIWYWEARKRQGIYDIRQLLQFADAVRMPRQALLPVIFGPPGGLPAGPGEVPACAVVGAAGHG
jgi:transcriptional regulator with XRE-family HTH domain